MLPHHIETTERDSFLLFENDYSSESPVVEIQSVSNGTDEEIHANFHPISCTRCRKLHKFCSKYKHMHMFRLKNVQAKTKPSCRRCTSQGLECIYQEPKRTMKVSSDASSKKRKRENETSPKYSKPNEITIEFEGESPWYFSIPIPLNFFICSNVDWSQLTLEKSLLEKYLSIYETSIEISETNLLERNAFYYSVKALLHQNCGQQIRAEEASTKCKSFISKVSNANSILQGYTYLNLAILELGEGNSQLASFHLYCAKYFTQIQYSNFGNLSKLTKTISIVEKLSLLGEVDILQLATNLPDIIGFISGKELPIEIVNALQQVVSNENCEQIVNIGTELIRTCVSDEILKIYHINQEPLSDNYLNGLEFTQNVLIEGLKIGTFTSSLSRRNIIEDSALKLTYLSETESFQSCSIFMIPFFVMATRVNIQIVKSIENGRRVNNLLGISKDENEIVIIDYYEILERNRQALQSLNSRFIRISKVHDKILQTMDELLRK